MAQNSWFRTGLLYLVDTWLEYTVFILLVGLIYVSWQFLKDENTVGLGILILCVGILTLSLISWLIFSLIDIRYLLKTISENTKREIDINPITKQESKTLPPVPAEDEKYCPYCNSIIKKNAKKCRFCNMWLGNNGGNT